jgi:ATP-dependent helicase/nuclease subunit A
MTATLTRFTEEQRSAIEAHSVSVALSAGAGCGKTFVLTERFLSHLEPSDFSAPSLKLLASAELHELIAITFTDRAAREMRDRIRKKCYERLQDAPLEQADYWLRLLRSLDSARVSTIHAFCGALLRAHAVEMGLDPRFVVVEQSQADTLLAEIIEDVIREKLSDPDDPLHEPLLNLTTEFGLKRLQSMVADLLRSGRSVDFKPWLSRTPQEVVTTWAVFHRQQFVPLLMKQIEENPATAKLVQFLQSLGHVPETLFEARQRLFAELPSLSTVKHPAAKLAELRELAKVPKGGKKVWGDDQLAGQFRDTAKAFRDAIDKMIGRLEFDPIIAQRNAEAGLQLLGVAHVIQERYNTRKHELAWLDFNDLLTKARQLLTDPAHAELQARMASRVRLLLVDECQDTDPLQVELIEAICGKNANDGKLFFVGDYKQSIYRFRGADPGVFRRLEQETSEAGRLPLSENFRSQPAILDFVNALFCNALSASENPDSASGKAALQYQPLRPHRLQVMPKPAVECLWAKASEDESKKKDAGATDIVRRREAEFIARRICGMIDQQEQIAADKQSDGHWTPRPVEYKDIAILFRTLSSVQFYEEALRNYGIHYYLVGGHAFYAQQEIHDIANLLRALASPADSISLAGVLRSPMFALTDETLFWLAQHSQGLSAGLFVDPLPRELNEADRHRAQFAAATLQHLRERKDRFSITALLNEALALTGYDAALLAEFMGERKLANLRKLLDQARTFDQSGVFGLADFIVQLSEFVVQMPREPLAATHPEGTNVVRLMTIHQAKGLEFPVVFLPDLNRRTPGEDDQAVWHPQLGPLVKLPTRSDKKGAISGLDLYRQLNDTEDQAERIRLLYVATTRAADYLVLSGGLFERDFESPSAPWIKLLAERFDLRTGKFIASLPKDERYHTPVVKVTTELPPVNRTSEPSHRQNLEQAVNRVLELAAQMKQQSMASKAAHSHNGDGFHRLAEPIAVDLAAQRRFSVSRLNGQLQAIEDESTPALLFPHEEQSGNPMMTTVAGTDLGVLVHQVLARLDFLQMIDSDHSIQQEKICAIVQHCIEASDSRTPELAQTAVELVRRFLQSDRVCDLTKAKTIHRELEFLLAWPPETTPYLGKGQGNGVGSPDRYLQGFIDCLYQDATGRWHLMDYKTNQVSTSSAASLAAQFELQLGVYALAVEQILRQPPVELAVHFLRTSAEHRFPWDSAMRQRTVDRVNQAIETAVMQK